MNFRIRVLAGGTIACTSPTSHRLVLVAWLTSFALMVAPHTYTCSALSFHGATSNRRTTFLRAAPENIDDNDSSSQDWRDFRAKLVLSNPAAKSDAPDAQTASTTNWAYDTGFLIEPGSLLVSRVESTLGCHDLNQPYMHKAVILLLEGKDEEGFTKGIILNRPTNLELRDDDIVYLNDDGTPREDLTDYSEEMAAMTDDDETTAVAGEKEDGNSWQMQFGGDISGLYDDEPVIVCLHSIDTPLSREVSDEVMKNVFVTSHDGACSLIEAGDATSPSDFFVFYGFCIWESGQLLRELERGSWTMVATNTRNIWEQLQLQRCDEGGGASLEPRAAGLDMWQTYMNMLSNNNEDSVPQEQEDDSFSDLMLKEWANEMLCIARDDEEDYFCESTKIYYALKAAEEGGASIGKGTVLRGASSSMSPFLLHEQLFHKSTVLTFQDDDDLSVGLILNHPTTDSYILETPNGKAITFNIRYGGPSVADNEDQPFMWLHCSKGLRKLGIGTRLNDDDQGIWTCTVDEVAHAIDSGFALPAEFMLVQGFSIWEKEGGAGGMRGQLLEGNFEVAVSDQIENMWTLLISQKCLSDESTLEWNVKRSLDSWAVGGIGANATANDMPRPVFDSNMTVSDLADEALRNWIAIFLLGDAEYAPF